MLHAARLLLLAAIALPVGASDAPARAAQSDFDRPFHKVYALCIGVNDYSGTGFNNLQCAANDARRLGDLFRTRFGYEVTVLTDAQASKAGIFAAFESLNAQMRADAARNSPPAFILFFAGHGHTVTVDADQHGYIVPHTTRQLLGGAPAAPPAPAGTDLGGTGLPPGLARKDGDDRRPGPEAGAPKGGNPFDTVRKAAQQEKALFDTEAISMAALRSMIADCGAKHAVLFLDSCYSGYATLNARSSRRKVEDPLVRDAVYWIDLQKPSRFIISGGGKDEQTFEDTTPRAAGGAPGVGGNDCHGIFTSELLRILGQSGAISTVDLYFHLSDEVARAAAQRGFSMNPRFTPLGADDGRFAFIPRDDNVWMGSAARLYVQDERVKAEARRASTARRRSAIDEAVDSKADFILVTKATTDAAKADRSRDPEWVARFENNLAKARAGDGVAMANVSYMYRYGLGTPKDARKAQTWALEARQSKAEEGALVAASAMAADTAPGRDPRVAEALAQEAAAQKQFIAGATLTFAGAAQGSPEAAVLGVITAAVGAARAGEESLFHSLAAMYRAYDAIPGALEAMRTSRDSAPIVGLFTQFRRSLNEVRGHADQARRDHDEGTDKHELAFAAVRACNALREKFDEMERPLGRGVRGIDDAHKAWRESGHFLLRLESLVPYFAPPPRPDPQRRAR